MELRMLHTDKKAEEKGKAFLNRHRTGIGRPPSPKWISPTMSATPLTRKGKPGTSSKA